MPVSRQTANKTQYDFIIAGGGLSGLSVADRLTEDASGMKLSPASPNPKYCTPVDLAAD